KAIARQFHDDPKRLMDILWACHLDTGFLSLADAEVLAASLRVSVPHIQEVVSFYHFFHSKPAGTHTIYLDTAIVAQHAGMAAVKAAFEAELGVKTGGVSSDGLIGLFE